MLVGVATRQDGRSLKPLGADLRTRGTSKGVVAFGRVGLDWRKHVRTDPKLLRPAEVERLVGDASKAQRQLAWQPTVDFKRLIAMMVDADLERLTETPKLATPAKAV